MICHPCREGAEWNTRWTEVLERGEGPDYKSMESLAKLNHEHCNGRCDCQHVVGRTARAGKEPK